MFPYAESKGAIQFDSFFVYVLIWNRMCSVPNAFACMEIKAMIRILSFTHFVLHTLLFI